VMPYHGYQLYQAERIKTDAGRRQADVAQGMMAAEVSRLWQSATRPLGALLRYRDTKSRGSVRGIGVAGVNSGLRG